MEKKLIQTTRPELYQSNNKINLVKNNIFLEKGYGKRLEKPMCKAAINITPIITNKDFYNPIEHN
jgi:hypothetical protein